MRIPGRIWGHPGGMWGHPSWGGSGGIMGGSGGIPHGWFWGHNQKFLAGGAAKPGFLFHTEVKFV